MFRPRLNKEKKFKCLFIQQILRFLSISKGWSMRNFFHRGFYLKIIKKKEKVSFFMCPLRYSNTQDSVLVADEWSRQKSKKGNNYSMEINYCKIMSSNNSFPFLLFLQLHPSVTRSGSWVFGSLPKFLPSPHFSHYSTILSHYLTHCISI